MAIRTRTQFLILITSKIDIIGILINSIIKLQWNGNAKSSLNFSIDPPLYK